MHPELWNIPGLASIKSYGFMLMIGFLSAVWFAMRRAVRVKANPDVVLNMSFVALLAGVAGARIFFVVHYWRVEFAEHANPVLAIIDLRAGGLEFLGGLLGAFLGIVLYLLIKRESLRLYLDIMAPGAMWGLAFGRIGCFLNGCCFGGVCELPWAVEFPFGSPAYVRQWEDRQIRVPAELINVQTRPVSLVSAAALDLSPDERFGPQRKVESLQKELEAARAEGASGDEVGKIEKKLASARSAMEKFERDKRLGELEFAQTFPARVNPQRGTSPSELLDLAHAHPALAVHPVQLYASIHGFVASALLSAVFYRRQRHGFVIGLLFVTYAVARVFEEMIRVDNPHDTAGLTVSQFVSLLMFVGGAAYLFILYRFLPQRSPYAVAYETSDEATKRRSDGAKKG